MYFLPYQDSVRNLDRLTVCKLYRKIALSYPTFNFTRDFHFKCFDEPSQLVYLYIILQYAMKKILIFFLLQMLRFKILNSKMKIRKIHTKFSVHENDTKQNDK